MPTTFSSPRPHRLGLLALLTFFLFTAAFAGSPSADGATSGAIRALPQATGIAIGGDNLTRLIWNNINGTYSLWTLNGDGSVGTQATYGSANSTNPVQQLRTVAVGPNNASRLLWNYYTGNQAPTSQVSLWNATDANPAATALTYGPYSGWYGTSLAVGSNNAARLLWLNTSGQVELWNFADANPSATYQLYGPYSGWTAQAIAAGADNKVRILWDSTDGRIWLWNQSDANPVATALVYGPYTGWTGKALAVGPNNVARMLWTNPSGQGQVSLWNFADASPSATCYTYTNPSGYSAVGIAVGTDNLVRLLWSGSGTAQVWIIAADGTYTSKTYSAVPSIVVSPASATLNTGGTQRFTAVASDQSGKPLSPQPAITWTYTGVGTISTSGLYSAGTTAGTATVTATSGTVSGNATVTVNASSSPPVLSLTAAATGANKITLYWNGISGASGYDVYRSTVSGGPYTLIAQNVSTPDNGPGLTSAFMYSDSAGLTTGTEYFYVVWAVQSGAETVQSNEDSAIPDSSAVPWDTGNAAQIVAAVNATATNDLQPDDDGSGGTIPQQVGTLFIGAPDGIVYMGNAPDGAPPQAYIAPGKTSNGSFVYDDGVVVSEPDYNPNAQSATATTQSVQNSSASPLATVGDHSPYPATRDPSGIYREVQAFQGFYGMNATLGLPDPTDPNQVRLVSHTSTVDPTIFYPSVGDIYSGGWVSFPAGTFGVGVTPPDFQLDAGLQLVPHPGGQPLRWSPIVGNAHRNNPKLQNDNKLHPETADKIYLDGSVYYLPVGKQKKAAAYKTYIKGEVRMQFLTPDFPSVRNKSVRLHFSIPVGGAGTGGIEVDRLSSTGVPTPYPNVQYITLEMFNVDGWLKAPYTGANKQSPANGNNQFIIKRVNSLAQTLQEVGDPNTLNYKHPGAPFANAPANQAFQGYLTDGSYLRPFGGATFSGAYWGNLGDDHGVELWRSTGGWVTWTDDSSITGAAGAYPNGYNNVVNWLVQNPYFWEQNVFLYAQ